MTADPRSGVTACAVAVQAGRTSVREVAAATLAAIARDDDAIRAFTAVDDERVLVEARRLDIRLARGSTLGPLAGVPVAIKDLIDVRGLPTSYGSSDFVPYVAGRDATLVHRLRAAGALIVGKVRTTEFAWSQHSLPTVNPRDPRLSTGGSSSGPAAAVAAGFVPTAIGSDTGGSIRIPASLCGVVGIKPTFGVVGRGGVLPANWTLDTLGPLTRSCDDARVVLAALVGHDPGDPWSASASRLARLRATLSAPGRVDLRRIRLGVLDEPLFEVNDARIQQLYDATLEELAGAGAELVQLRLPEAAWVSSTLIAIDLPDAAAVHTERLRARTAWYATDLAGFMRVCHLVPAALVGRGHAMRRRIQAGVRALFRDHRLDALVAPTNPVPPPPNDELGRAHRRADGELERDGWALGRAVWLANVTGQPSLTLPISVAAPPAGLQLIGRPYGDADLLSIGSAVERMLSA